jgi:uncharacterized protein YqgC (DUF456 family)
VTALTALVALAILVGLIGIVVPVLPGLLLSYGAVVVWVILVDGQARWAVLAVSTLLLVVSQVVKYLVPGRRLRAAGVPTRSTLAGVVLGIVGFFVVPVVGLFLGFVLGIYLAELARLREPAAAWPSTVHALKAVGVSILIELAAGLLILATWIAGVVATV